MAHIITKAVFIFAAFVAVISTSIASARSHTSTGKIYVNGTLYCSADGSNSGCYGHGPPFFPNARVQLMCRPGVIKNSPKNTTTDASGAYLVVLIPHSNATVSSIASGCHVAVLTCLSTCDRALPPARLVSSLEYVKVAKDGSDYITYMVASGFTIKG